MKMSQFPSSPPITRQQQGTRKPAGRTRKPMTGSDEARQQIAPFQMPPTGQQVQQWPVPGQQVQQVQQWPVPGQQVQQVQQWPPTGQQPAQVIEQWPDASTIQKTRLEILSDETVQQKIFDGAIAKLEFLAGRPKTNNYYGLNVKVRGGPFRSYKIPESYKNLDEYFGPTEQLVFKTLDVEFEWDGTVSQESQDAFNYQPGFVGLDQTRGDRVLNGWVSLLRAVSAGMTDCIGLYTKPRPANMKILTLGNVGFCFALPADSDLLKIDPITKYYLDARGIKPQLI